MTAGQLNSINKFLLGIEPLFGAGECAKLRCDIIPPHVKFVILCIDNTHAVNYVRLKLISFKFLFSIKFINNHLK